MIFDICQQGDRLYVERMEPVKKRISSSLFLLKIVYYFWKTNVKMDYKERTVDRPIHQ